MNFKNFWLASLALLLLVGCKSEELMPSGAQVEPSNTERGYGAHQVNLDLDVAVDEDIVVREAVSNVRSTGITLERKGTKFRTKFADVSEGQTVRVMVELKNANNDIFYGFVDAKVFGEKDFKIKLSNVTFSATSLNARLTPRDKESWKVRLTLGGREISGIPSLIYDAPKELIDDRGERSDLSSLTGKLPFGTQAWVDVQVKMSGSKPYFVRSKMKDGKEVNNPIEVKPMGNILRLTLRNEYTQDIKVKKIVWESNNMVSKGAIAVGRQHQIFQPTDVSQSVERVFTTPLSLTARGGESRFFLWVIKPDSRQDNTSIKLDFEESKIDYKNVPVLVKEEDATLTSGKSSALLVKIKKEIRPLGLARMAPNFLYGNNPGTNPNLKFATTYKVKTFVDDGTMGTYYEAGSRNAVQMRGIINIDGKRWRFPTYEDVVSVFPAAVGEDLQNLAPTSSYRTLNEGSIDMGDGAKEYKTWYWKSQDKRTFYAIRFLDANGNTTPHTAVYKYQRVGEWVDTRSPKNDVATLDITGRPIGSWHGESAEAVRQRMWQSDFWTNNNSEDIFKQLPPRGRGRDNFIQGNGHQVIFYADRHGDTRNKGYQIQNMDNSAFNFFSPGGGTGASTGINFNTRNKIPILLWEVPN